MSKKCEKCECKELHTETGIVINRYFKNGILQHEQKKALPRRVWCDGCNYCKQLEEE